MMSQQETILESGDPTLQEDIEIDEDDVRLKGDAIGDTLFSESWLLKTLMKLTQDSDSDEVIAIELDEDLEKDLCLLWDMTADKEVAACLHKHDIISIVKCVLSESRAPRLTEIIVGILANLTCQKDMRSHIITDQELMVYIIDYLSNEDSLVLLQCIRLLDTLARSTDCADRIGFLTSIEAVWSHLAFILRNSLNEDLLCASSHLLDVLLSHVELENTKFPCKEILSGIVECLDQLWRITEGEYSYDVKHAFDALVSSLYNLCRNKEMRCIINNVRDEVSLFLVCYLSNLLKRFREAHLTGKDEDEIAPLTASAVEAVTIYYLVIESAHCPAILEMCASIGSEMPPFDHETKASHYAFDYREIVGDCFRKLLDTFDSHECLHMLDQLDASILIFLLQAAHIETPERLEKLIVAGRSFDTFNKVIETYESFTGGALAR